MGYSSSPSPSSAVSSTSKARDSLGPNWGCGLTVFRLVDGATITVLELYL